MNKDTNFNSKIAIGLWILLLAVSGWILLRHTVITSDLTAFLPRSTTPTQQLLMSQLRDGATARLILIGIEGNDTQQLADTSNALATGLKTSGLFAYVNNGASSLNAKEREVLFRYRYLLSPAVSPERYSTESLREFLQSNLQWLSTDTGTIFKRLLPSDPTREVPLIMSSLLNGNGPAMQHGVWFSKDGKRALLIAQTLAPGFDIDKQQQLISATHKLFDSVRTDPQLRLILTGPSVFAVGSRDVIERDSWLLSSIALSLAIALLFSVYRSWKVVLLAMLPVLSGLIVGIAAVSIAFGSVHGITMGFAAILIGEAVDYPSYLFTHVKPGESLRETLTRIWPTLRVAILTTVCGSLTMLLSGFSGLSQLGLLATVGVLTAGMVTRWVLPSMAPSYIQAPSIFRKAIWAIERIGTSYSRFSVIIISVGAFLVIAFQYKNIWDNDLANMSPIPPQLKALDKQLRSEIGAPDVRYLIAVSGTTTQQALEHSEEIVPLLQSLVQRNAIGGYDFAAKYLPSIKTQRARQAALPDPNRLQNSLRDAARDLPFRDGVFSPFIRDVATAKTGRLLELSDLAGSAFSLKVNSLLFNDGGRWIALIVLNGVQDAGLIQEFFQSQKLGQQISFLDLSKESSEMINSYRNESLKFTGLGAVAILVVLVLGLNPRRMAWRVILPVGCAIVTTIAILIACGIKLSLFHLVSLLLVMGIGLNYALFFNRISIDQEEHHRTALALVICSLTTLSAFGILALSRTPVLQAIGITVTLGALGSLLASAALAKKSIEPR